MAKSRDQKAIDRWTKKADVSKELIKGEI